MYKVIKQQFINFLIYTSVMLLFATIRHSEGFTLNMYSEPVFLFSCIVFICSTLVILAGQKIFRQSQFIIYLLPQIIGFLLLTYITIGNKINGYSSIGYGIDELVWSFLIITALLNVIAYFASNHDRHLSKTRKNISC